jgi:GNAT superfamily N-acetyltransferase
MPQHLPLALRRCAALPPDLVELAVDAAADGQRMLDVLREDFESGALRFDGPGEALFGAYSGDLLVGLGGLTRDPYLRGERAGRVRRLYVRRSARRHGAGRMLVRAIVGEARVAGWPRLRARAPDAAFAFYEACGFLRVVGEASATHVMPLAGSSPGMP